MPLRKKLLITTLATLLSFNVYAHKGREASRTASTHTCTRHDSATLSLACAIYAEARGQGSHGMFSVGNVVLNRVDDGTHPDSIRKVILQKDQFSYTTSLPFKVEDKNSFNEALNISEDLITMNSLAPDLRAVVDPTQGATYFKTKRIHPEWSRAKGFKLTYTYKEHQFFKEE